MSDDFSRKIDGKRFYLTNTLHTARGATVEAESLRRQGFRARILTRRLGPNFFFDVYRWPMTLRSR